MSVPKKAIPILKKTIERIDDGDGRFARLGNWRIALGGYDEGYDVAYRGEDVFRVNYELREYEVLDQSIAKDVIEDMKVALDCQRFKDVTEWEDVEDIEDEDDEEFEPIEEARRKKASGTEADEATKQKMVIAMDMKGWEQQGDSLEFYNPSKDEGKEFDNWAEVYDFILELYGYK
jgi:hypothetical protein